MTPSAAPRAQELDHVSNPSTSSEIPKVPQVVSKLMAGNPSPSALSDDHGTQAATDSDNNTPPTDTGDSIPAHFSACTQKSTALQTAGTPRIPKKRIISPAHLKKFQDSQTFADILDFVQSCNGCVLGKSLDQEVEQSAAIRAILDLLQTVKQIQASTPPDTSGPSSRFGNPAFRTFYARLKERCVDLLASIPGLDGEPMKAYREELSVYLQESWGNEKRIDYGSGMELNFACWLLCLVKLGILKLPEDGAAIVLKVFWKYIGIMRDIQSTYWLEPAGSHGVWGLDDYHFLPFLWGAGQLSNHRHLRPKSIHDEEIIEEFSKSYMYFACIKFINSVKTASLRWHSPMLDDISGVKTWSKVNEGMMKMYKAEVLLKLPIAQHIFFGSLLPFPVSEEEEEKEEADQAMAEEDEHGHLHHKHGTGEGQAAGWGDCCGIPIPSVFAAAKQEREKAIGGGYASVAGATSSGTGGPKSGYIRRIPFD
ncbi:PTPA-domain-containing protein [Violaceomyces palustris]|uniref:PTPA-domain-containing protein n=1 Tax=Violaceomyces palustris TaxID=1673888 RepID=A0ACD0NP26_9BASI|nr:PTPA-domain-containing protein [Violaceomyces palustris]